MDQMSLVGIVFISIPEAALLAFLGYAMYGFRLTAKQILLISVPYALCSYLIRLAPVPFGVHTVTLMVVLALLSSLMTKSGMMVALLSSLSASAVYLTMESVVAPLTIAAVGRPVQDILQSPFLRVVSYLPEAMLLTAICWAVVRFDLVMYDFRTPSEHSAKIGIKESQRILARVLLSQTIIPVALLSSVLIAAYAWSQTGITAGSLTLYCGVIILIEMSVGIWSYRQSRRIIRLSLQGLEAEEAQRTLHNLESLIMSCRKQRHDFANHVGTMNGLLEMGAWGDAKQYIGGLYKESLNPGELIKTDNHVISSLLWFKIGQAEARNVALNVYIQTSLREFPLAADDTTSVLGNLIDNAIDATEHRDPKDRAIEMTISGCSGFFIIQTSNPGELPVDVTWLHKGYSTKTGHQGIGLSIVQDITTRYGGTMDFEMRHGQVIFTVGIPRVGPVGGTLFGPHHSYLKQSRSEIGA